MKVGDTVIVVTPSMRYMAMVDKIGRKFVHVKSVGTKTQTEKFDIQTGFLVLSDGTLSNKKRIV